MAVVTSFKLWFHGAELLVDFFSTTGVSLTVSTRDAKAAVAFLAAASFLAIFSEIFPC